ncbi:amidase [Halobacteriales archaeon QS_5_70_15]|nr:MAG: amidase [Halobacteriales archaeon QS_5_70_15]
MTDATIESAAEIARRVRAGERSPVEVLEARLDRIDELDDEVNAFVTVTAGEARETAREVERAVERGEDPGPLAGVPVAVKDLENVVGVRTTFGSKPLADTVAEESEPFVERLREAGAVVVGKTNTPEFGHKGTTDNLVAGATGTPFDPSRNAGGSSGGSAAAVAARMVPIAQGSDGGGSVRIPSAWCGVYGLKPTYRRIPRPGEPDAFSHTPFSQLGPHARTVEDAALMLEVMAGPGPGDPLVLPDDGTDYLGALDRDVSELRVAYCPDLGTFPLDERVRAVVDDAVRAFEACGATVERVDSVFEHTYRELRESWMTGFFVSFAALAENLRESEGVDYLGADRADTTPAFAEAIETGRETSAVEYKRADNVRTSAFLAVQELFEEYDLLASATLAVPPVENRDDGNTVGPTEVGGEPVDQLVGWCLTYPFNMTGHPSASIPAGLDDDGLPVGLQLTGPRFEDETVLGASAAFERERPWQDIYDSV